MWDMTLRFVWVLCFWLVAIEACESYNLEEWEEVLNWVQHLPILHQVLHI